MLAPKFAVITSEVRGCLWPPTTRIFAVLMPIMFNPLAGPTGSRDQPMRLGLLCGHLLLPSGAPYEQGSSVPTIGVDL